MHSTFLSLGLSLSNLLSPLSAACQGPTVGPVPPSKPAAEDSRTSIFGEPLYVNGKRITDNQIKLFLVYGPCKAVFEMARIGVILEDELHRRATEAAEQVIRAREAQKPFASDAARKAAVDAELLNQLDLVHEKFAVSEEEVQKEVDRMVADFKKNYPVLDLDSEIRRGFRSVDWYRQQMRQTVLFDHVFLPPNPDEWPVVTTESVRADSENLLIDDAYTSWKARKEMAEKQGIDLPKEDPIYMGFMRDIVRSAVFKLVDFKTLSEGLPDNLCLWADATGDGKPELVITTDEMWDKVKDTVSETEIREAKRWFVTSVATRDRLEKDGFLLSGDDCSAALDALCGKFDNSAYNVESLATTTYYFPSVQTYKQYYCMLESFKKMQEPKLQPGPGGELAPALRERFEKANRVMGLGQVDLEVMLISAFDIPHFRWKPDGWNWAEKKAKEIVAQVEENTRAYNEQRAKIVEAHARGEEYKPEKEVQEPYRFWTQMMDDHSEWWDPPPPAGEGKRASMVGYKMRGRLGPHYRNDLIGFMEETYYTQWVTGDAITDYVFFDQAEGTVAGPFKASKGYYITRVMTHTPPSRSLNLSEPKHIELLRDDWLRVTFMQYAKAAAAQASVKGI